jgi:hypothetical protein
MDSGKAGRPSGVMMRWIIVAVPMDPRTHPSLTVPSPAVTILI